MRKNNKILMLINEFPPTGESGVQRALKFLKYLDRANYETFVITPQEPVKEVLDHSLVAEIPTSSKVFKTKSWGIKAKNLSKIENLRYTSTRKKKSLKWRVIKSVNDLFFPLDKQIGWVPFAYFKAVKVVKREGIRNVYITGYPFSAFLIGVLLKLRFKHKIFFLADYRDSWGFEPLLEKKVNRLRMSIMRWCDKIVLHKADYIISVTTPILAEYIDHFPFVAGKSALITNGYDEDDFLQLKPKLFTKKTIVYMGKFYDFKRNPFAFFKALDRYIKETKEEIEFIHIGTAFQELFDFVEHNNYTFYKYLGYKSHQEALEYSLGADYLLLCINDDPSSKYVYSGKLFEYIRLGKPIIGLIPLDGIVSDLIKEYSLGIIAPINDETEIYNSLLRLNEHKNKQIPQEVIYNFSREKLTKDLIEIYEKNI
ncbi:MAG: glycosyltransferase [Candidatus Cloacimonadales bacterium]